jgi:hypothetical protein
MILIVGSVIGVIIISIYLPMFGIYDKVGTGMIIPVIFSQLWQRETGKIREGLNLLRAATDPNRAPAL